MILIDTSILSFLRKQESICCVCFFMDSRLRGNDKSGCRKKVLTVGSTIDCLIAQTAIENNLLLLYNDEDFNRMAKVVELRFY